MLLQAITPDSNVTFSGAGEGAASTGAGDGAATKERIQNQLEKMQRDIMVEYAWVNVRPR